MQKETYLEKYMEEIEHVKPKGFCIWLTGLPCSGKTTIANTLKEFFENLGRTVTVIDGDIIRQFLSNGDFSKEARIKNNFLAGYIASEIVKHGGIVICALVSPFEKTRQTVRSFFEEDEFMLVYLNPPLDMCIQRDVKGMYKKALSGEIKNFTGINDEYEPPCKADLIIDTSLNTISETVEKIIDFIFFKRS